MSTSDLAAELGLSLNTTYAALARGEIAGAYRFGSRWRISRRAFEKAYHGEGAN